MLSEPERALILLCARQTLPEGAGPRGRVLFDRTLQWDALADAAWRHGVAPLLFRNLQQLDEDGAVPPKIMDRLRQSYVRSAFRYRVHSAAVAALAQSFLSQRVDLLLLKGAALAPTIYHQGGLRPFGDIDLLVRENDIDAARKILETGGYQIAPGLLSEKFSRRYHVNLPFVRGAPPPVHVELHWRLTDRFSGIQFDHTALFARARRIQLPAGEASSLALEDELIYLAAHLDNHGYLNRSIVERGDGAFISLHELSGDRLIWFTDLHELIVAGGLDWASVIARARLVRADGALAISLRLMRSLLGTPLDERVLQELPLPELRWPERKVGEYVVTLAGDAGRPRAQAFWRDKILVTRTGFELRLIRLLDLWQYLFPARSAVRHSYPGHVCGAFLQCGKMFLELLWLRVFRFLRAKGGA